MRKLIKYFIKYHTSADVILLFTAIVGIMAMFNIQRSQFPRSESTEINIETRYIGASPKEVEEGISTKIEQEVKGIEGVRKITSKSVENQSKVKVILYSNVDVDKALNDVKNAVDRVNTFPAAAETPVIFKEEMIDLAADFVISGDVDLKTLKEYGDKVERELLDDPAISKIIVTGYPEQEIEIAVREEALQTYGLSFEEVARSIARSNLELTGGKLELGSTNITIRAKNKQYEANRFANIIVKTNETGANILLSDIAELNEGWADSPERNYYNGQPAVKFTVQSRLTEDIILAATAAFDYIEEFNKIGGPMKATLLTDGSQLIQQRTDLLVENGAIGILLVLLVLGLFLKPRIAFWVALSIPISIAGMFIIAPFFGMNINMLSLFGLILVIGILVDDGVVIAENIFQKHEEGLPPLKAALEGVTEVVPSIISAVLTTCWFFFLFFMIEGRLGDFMSNIGFVVIVTLLFSLIEGFFILPAHIAHSKALKQSKPGGMERATTWFFEFLKEKIYRPTFNFCTANKTLSFSTGIVLLVLSVNLVRGGYVTATFFPYIDTDDIIVTLKMPAGTSETVTKEKLDQIEKAAWTVSKHYQEKREDGREIVRAVVSSVGKNAHEGTVFIALMDGEARGFPGYEVSNAITEEVGELYGAESIAFGRPSIFGAAIQMAFVGDNMDNLRGAKNELKKVLEAMPELKDVADNDKTGGKEIYLELTDKAKALGVDLQTVINQVRQGFFGYEVQRLQRGTDEVKVWVRYGVNERQSIANLEKMNIRVGNKNYQLKELANLEMQEGLLSIAHVNGRTKLEVTAEQLDPNASISAIVAEMETVTIPKILKKYPGVDVIFEGQSENAAETIGSIKRWLPVVLLLVFFTVVLTFRSFKQTIMVFIMIPFAFIGVVFGHWLHGVTISMLSVFGILAVAGVVINDSLVLISTMNRYLREGMKFKDAVQKASVSRFRPIVLTSVTTIAGLMPLVLETSMQAQFLIPMAIALSYGLAACTLTMLLLLPVVIVAFNDSSRWLWWLWEGEDLEPEEFEPAVQELEHEFE